MTDKFIRKTSVVYTLEIALNASCYVVYCWCMPNMFPGIYDREVKGKVTT